MTVAERSRRVTILRRLTGDLPARIKCHRKASMKERRFICWALRDGDQLFYQGWGYPKLYATEDEAEADIRNPHLNPVQVEVIVHEA